MVIRRSPVFQTPHPKSTRSFVTTRGFSGVPAARAALRACSRLQHPAPGRRDGRVLQGASPDPWRFERKPSKMTLPPKKKQKEHPKKPKKPKNELGFRGIRAPECQDGQRVFMGPGLFGHVGMSCPPTVEAMSQPNWKVDLSKCSTRLTSEIFKGPSLGELILPKLVPVTCLAQIFEASWVRSSVLFFQRP